MTSTVCPKRGFASERLARATNRNAPFRIRAYLCDVCHLWHVTNHEKRHTQGGTEDWPPRRSRRTRTRETPDAVPAEQQPMASLVARLALCERELATAQGRLDRLLLRIEQEAARQESAALDAGQHDDPDAPERKRAHAFAASVVDSLLWE